jgi:flavin reductase (DIM6/NTAB) family NADH-FMN oxidoreductase RutF
VTAAAEGSAGSAAAPGSSGAAPEPGRAMPAPDGGAFRRAAGRLPTGIVVVCTSLHGIGHAMTVSAFTSVSLEPLLVLFCAEKIARFHDAVLDAGIWSVSVLDQESEKTARWLATRGRPLEGQLDQIAHHPGPVTGAPILDAALASLECRTTAVHDGGDHSIVVGAVVGVGEPQDGGPQDGGPLIYYGGGYRRLAAD